MTSLRAGRRAGRGAAQPPAAVDVVLVERAEDGEDPAGEADGATADGGAAGSPSAGGGRRRRPLVVLGLVVLVVAALAAVATVVETRREAALLARLAEVPGVLEPLDEPPVELWRVPGWFATTLGELVLVVDPAGSDLRAVDPATGAVRWTRTGPAGHVELCDESPLEHDPDLLLCAAYGGVPATEGTVSVVTVVRASDGATVAERRVDGAVVLREAHGGDQLVATVDRASHVRVVRWAPAAGRDVWAWTSPDPVPSDGTTGVPRVEVRDGAVVLDGVALDLATGAVRSDVPPDGPDVVAEPVLQELASGHRVVQSWLSGGMPGPIVVEAPDGTPLHDLDGRLAPPWSVDDGSRPGLVLVEADGGLSALDVATGEPRWTVDGVGFGETVALVDGLLVREETDAAAATTLLVVRDADDGTVRWRRPTTGQAGWTDGRVVLVRERSTRPSDGADLVRGLSGAPADLVARRLVDGTETWRVTLPPHDWLTVAEDGTVLLVGPEEVAGWR